MERSSGARSNTIDDASVHLGCGDCAVLHASALIDRPLKPRNDMALDGLPHIDHPSDDSLDLIAAMSVMLEAFDVEAFDVADKPETEEEAKLLGVEKPLIDPSAIQLFKLIDLSTPASPRPTPSLRSAKIIKTKTRTVKARPNPDASKARRRDQTRDASRRFRNKQKEGDAFLNSRLEKLGCTMPVLYGLREKYGFQDLHASFPNAETAHVFV